MHWTQKPRKRKFQLAVGDRFGRLILLEVAEYAKHKNKLRCDCGKEHFATSGHLRDGDVSSCGCVYVESRATCHRTHGESKRGAEYNVWVGMRDRCANPNDDSFVRYGGRGIRVCERWQTFELFLEDMGPRPSKRHSIERIDNDGHYEPGNCRWATGVEQGRNKRNNVLVTHNGITRTVSEWAEITGIKYGTVWMRIKRGYSPEKALSLESYSTIPGNQLELIRAAQ